MPKSLDQFHIEAMVKARREKELQTTGLYLDNEARLLGASQNIHQIAAMQREQKNKDSQFKKSA